MKIGIIFGGQSREREVSFAGGRTVYDNLDKNLFEPVPIFVDSLGNFILLDWQYIYKGTIRDFYPPAEVLKNQDFSFQYYIESLGDLDDETLDRLIRQVGERVFPHQFKDLFDFAFLALHGTYGEDGNIQGLLEWYGVPYSGSGILPSAIGVNKMAQSEFLRAAGFHRPKQVILAKSAFENQTNEAIALIFNDLQKRIGFPMVIKSPNQGSSIGVSIFKENDLAKFIQLVNKSLFIQKINASDWQKLDKEAKEKFIIQFTDIREGLGFPVIVQTTQKTEKIYHPQELWQFLENNSGEITLKAENVEEFVIIEEFIGGKEFSCIVVQDENGAPAALPPTEIRKYNDVFDYRSKYLPGQSRKITPIEVDSEVIEQIRQECCRLFTTLNCNVYARIDGFVAQDGRIILNDPNTTSGMLPSSFFFHQSAEIGLDSKNFLTYIIRTSIAERIKGGKKNYEVRQLLQNLDAQIAQNQAENREKIRVAVIMGGYSTERHISMESGRNIYEKLASSTKYAPFPVFLTGEENRHELYILPINYMLKDNADDVKDKIRFYESGVKSVGKEALSKIQAEFSTLTQKYTSDIVLNPLKISYLDLKEKADVVFIALHGRPGEDGAVQKELNKLDLPYNGSGVESSQITINKFETNEILRKQGIKVAQHILVYQSDWERSENQVVSEIERNFRYPLIAKPADDGCSSAVKKIRNREQFIAFAQMMFRPQPEFLAQPSEVLQLKPNEEFPKKNYFLVEELIAKGEAKYFLEITGGMLTKVREPATTQLIDYEVFEPSEALATGDVLSLEEKFLAGEGQNITPAVYSPDEAENQQISLQVRAELEKVAKILHVEGYCRIDAFVRVYEPLEVETIIIEVNSLPGMTPATCIFHQAALNDYKPYHFIDGILNFAMARKKLNE
ncbi:MAG: D-alanine--D-alanine ligase [Microscillaceae bacterium]|jgi:D-alanine-D-alanine ligase|nr:D-alanine--D-alanine ligase [Microscillaceae bacterium]